MFNKDSLKFVSAKDAPKQTGLWIFLTIIIIGLIVIVSGPTLDSGPIAKEVSNVPVENIEKNQLEVYQYEILREWSPNGGKGYEMVLEAPDLTQEGVERFVMNELATKADNVFARLYLSKEAWQAEAENDYGGIYKEGYLAYVLIKNGEVEIRWFQEKGSLENLNNTVTEIK